MFQFKKTLLCVSLLARYGRCTDCGGRGECG